MMDLRASLTVFIQHQRSYVPRMREIIEKTRVSKHKLCTKKSELNKNIKIKKTLENIRQEVSGYLLVLKESFPDLPSRNFIYPFCQSFINATRGIRFISYFTALGAWRSNKNSHIHKRLTAVFNHIGRRLMYSEQFCLEVQCRSQRQLVFCRRIRSQLNHRFMMLILVRYFVKLVPRVFSLPHTL